MTYYAKGKKMWHYPSNSTIERLREKGYRQIVWQTEILFVSKYDYKTRDKSIKNFRRYKMKNEKIYLVIREYSESYEYGTSITAFSTKDKAVEEFQKLIAEEVKHELGIESFWSLRNPKKIFYYAANGGTPYFAYTTEEYAITDEQIASGEYVVVDESRKRYRKLSEVEEQESEITPISEKFYALFMQYYREKAIKGLFAVRIKTDEYERYIKPRANCNGYYYGYRLDHIKNYPSVQKKWAFPYERAYLYSIIYNAQIIPIA